jgi:hypothetical protein
MAARILRAHRFLDRKETLARLLEAAKSAFSTMTISQRRRRVRARVQARREGIVSRHSASGEHRGAAEAQREVD